MKRSRLPFEPPIPSPSPSLRGGGPVEWVPQPVLSEIEPGEPWLLDSREVARLLGISRTKAFQLMARGEVPTFHLGRCARVPRGALMEWITERTQRPGHLG